MDTNFPKVLIISHNALSKTQNNGKTIETFFDKWPKKNIMHLYFSAEYEDLDYCDTSFCVHDYDSLDNFFRLKKIHHGRILKEQLNHNKEKDKYLKFVKQYYVKNRCVDRKNVIMGYLHKEIVNRKPILLLFRYLIWKDKKWFMDDIYEWVKKENPKILFFQGGNSSFSYEIVMDIHKKYNIPIILECTDDYTKKLNPYSFIESYLNKKYLKSFKTMIKYCESIFVISDKMRREYSATYGGKNYRVLSNSIQRNNDKKLIDLNKKVRLLYAGNLGLKRWDILCKLGYILDKLNNNYGYKLCLEIYTGSSLDSQMSKALNSIKSIILKGFIGQDELNLVVKNSDILVHVESFDKTNKKITKLSISTKIGEYISSNRHILAIGPSDIASIEYLVEKELACVCTSIEEEKIIEQLKKLLTDSFYRERLLINDHNESIAHFSQEHIDKTVYDCVSNVVNL